jgi:hypothetical protein
MATRGLQTPSVLLTNDWNGKCSNAAAADLHSIFGTLGGFVVGSGPRNTEIDINV